MSLEVAMLRAPNDYTEAVERVALAMIKQPLPRLQKLPGATVSDPFLYDDSFLGENVSRSTVRKHGDAIELKPGVAYALARLAGLLKPALEIMWVEDVRRMNTFLDADVPDVAGHLFGRERTALAAARAPFIRRRSDHTASTAERICRRTIRSTMCCRGHWWGLTAWRIWSWRADGATATRAMRCPRCRWSTAHSRPPIGAGGHRERAAVADAA